MCTYSQCRCLFQPCLSLLEDGWMHSHTVQQSMQMLVSVLIGWSREEGWLLKVILYLTYYSKARNLESIGPTVSTARKTLILQHQDLLAISFSPQRRIILFVMNSRNVLCLCQATQAWHVIRFFVINSLKGTFLTNSTPSYVILNFPHHQRVILDKNYHLKERENLTSPIANRQHNSHPSPITNHRSLTSTHTVTKTSTHTATKTSTHTATKTSTHTVTKTSTHTVTKHLKRKIS
jgi:hypothetical protein